MNERLAFLRCYNVSELEFPVGVHVLDLGFQTEVNAGRISRRDSVRFSRRATRAEIIAALRDFANRLEQEKQPEEQPDE